MTIEYRAEKFGAYVRPSKDGALTCEGRKKGVRLLI